MKIAVGSDHGGYDLKMTLIRHLCEMHYDVLDLGTDSGETSVSYVQFGEKTAKTVAAAEADLGLVVCGTGIGISMVCNKIKGIRCALCSNEYMAEMARRHNNANMLALGGRVIGPNLAISILDRFLNSEFEGGRHEVRVKQMMALESEK